MASVTKSPLCDFRAQNVPGVGVKATATTTARATPANPTGNNNAEYLVVQDITVCLAAGTVAQGPLQANLIDGTTGGTNIVWSGVLSAPATGAALIPESYLNIPCKSGFATLEFTAAGGTTSQQSVAFGGYYGGGYGN